MRKNSTTIQQERDRLQTQQGTRTYFKSSSKYGTIKEVHDKIYAVTVTTEDGGMAFGGRFIPVVNPWNELVHDYGNLRPGLLVELVFTGDQDTNASARIIGLEGEKPAALQQEPEINLALYEIFAPGS
jgi:hypothetical protein